jgi:hypothetical protein
MITRWDVETPWGVEASFYMEERAIPADEARTLVIMRWMCHGDLHPLAAAIEEGQDLDKAVLSLLAKMIWDGQLTVKPKGRGRPHSLGSDLRGIVAAKLYEDQQPDGGSDERFDFIAEIFRMSHQSVRQAVTAYRKKRKQTV